MAEFLVKMADERGRVLQQVESGFSETEVRDRYAQQGYLVYSVRPKSVIARELGFTRRKLRREPFVIFNSQFVTLVRAGLPILTALELLVKRQRDPFFRSLLENVVDRVKSGELLSDAFAAQRVIPKIYTTTLLAGEKSGNLEEVLTRYISFERISVSFQKKLKASLYYPALLLAALTVMLTFLVTYVIPQFAQLYGQFGSQLNPLTLFMLNVGLIAQKYFLLIFVGIALVIVALFRWRRSETGGRQLEMVQMRLPAFGDIWLKYQVAMFSRMLSTLLAGGLPLVPALETAGESMQSRLMKIGIAEAVQKVREGRPLARSIEETKFFPQLAIEMVEVGESTGALPAMLNSVADFFEEDVQTALAAAMSLVEPVILIFMGGVVAFVLLSLYLPIFQLGAAATQH